jgi:hypothetical protein
MSELDFTATNFDEYTVGELLAMLPDYRRGPYDPDTSTVNLMKVTQVGSYLLKCAVAIAYEQNNEEFFEEAFGFYGPLIDAALQELGLPRS